MKKQALYLSLICTQFLLLSMNLKAQNIEIKLGPDEVALNQYFTITVEVINDRLQGYDEFPEIEGFVKQGTSSSSSMNVINGQVSSTQSIIQNYRPTREGIFRLPAFTMQINGQTIRSQGKTIKVGPPVQRQQQFDPFNYDPFQDFFGRDQKQEYIEVKDDAFLALTTSKDEIYVGEGVNVTLAFYISETNQAPLNFFEIGKQLVEITKELEPNNCWEENFYIDKLHQEQVRIGNKRYARIKIYEATFFPFNDEDLEFPSIDLKMIKYKVAKNRSFFGRNRKQDFKTFTSKPKTVKVKKLPPHPLRESVSVGRFRLSEDISDTQLETGQSFNYEFSILGEGNISSINGPEVPEQDEIEFYPPNVQQNIARRNNKVRGQKSFKYYGIPNEPGTYDLANFMKWVYFDPVNERYDTLQSDIQVIVTGESKKNQYISSNDLGSFYDVIELEDNKLKATNTIDIFKLVTNIMLILMIGTTLYFTFRK